MPLFEKKLVKIFGRRPSQRFLFINVEKRCSLQEIVKIKSNDFEPYKFQRFTFKFIQIFHKYQGKEVKERTQGIYLKYFAVI